MFELVNEGLDMWLGDEAHLQRWQFDGAFHDVVKTMILPTALLLFADPPRSFQTAALICGVRGI